MLIIPLFLNLLLTSIRERERERERIMGGPDTSGGEAGRLAEGVMVGKGEGRRRKGRNRREGEGGEEREEDRKAGEIVEEEEGVRARRCTPTQVVSD